MTELPITTAEQLAVFITRACFYAMDVSSVLWHRRTADRCLSVLAVLLPVSKHSPASDLSGNETMSHSGQKYATSCDVHLHPVGADAAAGSDLSTSGGDDMTSRDVVDDVTGLLVRQCKSWTTKLSGDDDRENPSTSTTLSVTSAASSPTSPATVSRPPPSPRPSLTSSARPADPRSSVMKSESMVESPSAYFFTSNSTEDVVVDAAFAGTAGSDTSSGRGSASPDTRLSSRGKSRFMKMLRPLRRTRSAGCSEDFRKFGDSGHKPTGVQQVAYYLFCYFCKCCTKCTVSFRKNIRLLF